MLACLKCKREEENKIGPDIISIIIGSLLGDAHAEKREGGKGTRISIYQEGSNTEYLLWLHSKIASNGYCKVKLPKIQRRLGKGGKLRNIIRFHTFTYTSFNVIHEDWYTNGVKHVPSNIAEYLTPLALAVWIMDDGSIQNQGLHLNTYGFSKEEVELLKTTIEYLFANTAGVVLKCSIHSHSKGYRIYIWNQSMDIVRDHISQYMHKDMLYKINPELKRLIKLSLNI